MLASIQWSLNWRATMWYSSTRPCSIQAVICSMVTLLQVSCSSWILSRSDPWAGPGSLSVSGGFSAGELTAGRGGAEGMGAGGLADSPMAILISSAVSLTVVDRSDLCGASGATSGSWVGATPRVDDRASRVASTSRELRLPIRTGVWVAGAVPMSLAMASLAEA